MRPGPKSVSGGFIRNVCNKIVEKSLAGGGVRNRKDAKSKVRIKAERNHKEAKNVRRGHQSVERRELNWFT